MAHYDLPHNSCDKRIQEEDASGVVKGETPRTTNLSDKTVRILHTRILDLAEQRAMANHVSDATVTRFLHEVSTQTRAAVTELIPGLVHIDVHDDEGNLAMRYLARATDTSVFPSIDEDSGDEGLAHVAVENLKLGAIKPEDLRCFTTEEEHDENQVANSIVGAPLAATSMISIDVFHYYARKDAKRAEGARAIIHGHCQSINELRSEKGEWLMVECRSACPITLLLPAKPWRKSLRPGMIIEGIFTIVVALPETCNQ